MSNKLSNRLVSPNCYEVSVDDINVCLVMTGIIIFSNDHPSWDKVVMLEPIDIAALIAYIDDVWHGNA